MPHEGKYRQAERITCGVIEHTPLGATLLENFIGKTADLDLIWVCDYQENAHSCFERHNPNMVFMNLGQLPVEPAPLLRPILMYHTGIVITTGYSRREAGPIPFPYVDYLEKPVSFEKFLQSVKRYKQLRGRL